MEQIIEDDAWNDFFASKLSINGDEISNDENDDENKISNDCKRCGSKEEDSFIVCIT